MTTSRRYTLITPRLDRTGPCNVAVDIGRAALANGWQVSLLYLSEGPGRDDVQGFTEVRRFRWSDLLRTRGVVHTHCLRPDLMGWLLSWNRNCKTLTTLHNYFLIDLGFDHPQWQVRASWGLWRRAIAGLDHRVCISEAMCRYYRRVLPQLDFDLAYNFRSELLSPPAPPAPDLAIWLTEQTALGRVKLAYVGGLVPRKNLLPLLDAISRAPELSLILCGQGPQMTELRTRAKALGLDDRVLFAGQVLNPESIVAACDILVLPSHAEGLPLVTIEAARVGRPCLLSNIAVHRELASLGLGETFDRHRFSDFRERALSIARAVSPQSQLALKKLWQERFSDTAGFAQYVRLLDGIPARQEGPDAL